MKTQSTTVSKLTLLASLIAGIAFQTTAHADINKAITKETVVDRYPANWNGTFYNLSGTKHYAPMIRVRKIVPGMPLISGPVENYTAPRIIPGGNLCTTGMPRNPRNDAGYVVTVAPYLDSMNRRTRAVFVKMTKRN